MDCFNDPTEIASQVELEVTGLFKRFNAKNILNGVSLQVERGQIYAVLGPSGCGKTTLLRCILGTSQYDDGSIFIRSKRRRDIGYMPQELALQSDLTIKETLNFFGTINGLTKKEIATRISDLVVLLDFPSVDSTLTSVSSGQQRRVSLGVALLHDPKMVLLDEPTVGLDPLLRNRIWQHLIILTKVKEKAVIITTHYIEEAMLANMVGFMRFGKFIKQKPPLEIILELDCVNLEEAFFKLAEEQGTEEDSNKKVTTDKSVGKGRQLKQCINKLSKWDYRLFKAQLLKNITWQRRNKRILVFLILLPGLLAYLCNEILGSEVNHIPVAVVQDDNPRESGNGSQTLPEQTYNYDQSFIPGYLSSEDKTVEEPLCNKDYWSCKSSPLSCLYISALTSTISLVRYSSLEEGKESIREGKTKAVIHFNHKFSDAIRERLKQGIKCSDETIDAGTISVWTDMTNPWIGGKIKGTLSAAFLAFVSSLYLKCDSLSQDLSVPIKVETPIFGSFSSAFIHHALPGLLCLFCFYLSMMYTQSSVLMERKSGQIERCVASGLSLLEIILAHGVIQILLCFVQNVIMLSVCYIIYDNPQLGNWTLIFLLIILIEAMGTAYGLLLSVMFDSERLSTYAAVGTMVCLLGVLGIIWPYEGMHPVIKKTLWAAPIVSALQAYRDVALKGWTLANSSVAFGVAQTTALTACFLIAFSLIVHYKKISH